MTPAPDLDTDLGSAGSPRLAAAARTAQHLTAAALAVLALSSCTSSRDTTPADPRDPRAGIPTQTADPAPADDPAAVKGAVVQNSDADADLTLTAGDCRYDARQRTLVQPVSLTGTVTRPVVATVWVTATGAAGLIGSPSLGVPLEPGTVEQDLEVEADLAPVAARNLDCTVELTWTPRATG